MKYCSLCRRISFDDNEKCVCGRKFAKKYDFNDPAELITVPSDDQHRVESCLVKAKIPYSVQDDSQYAPVVGRLSGQVRFLVPISFLKKGLDALQENGISDKPDWYDKLDLPDDPQWEDMPEGKRRIVKAVSVIGFLVIIYLCVAGVDLAAAFITKLFQR